MPGARMHKSNCILFLLVLLGFGASLIVPVEDVPETPYDESETLPFEGTPLFSIAIPRASARITTAAESIGGSLLGATSSTKRGQRRRENNTWSRCVTNSLITLNHSLRC
jgi:hypothetical protein